jgi:hypothetical protein
MCVPLAVLGGHAVVAIAALEERRARVFLGGATALLCAWFAVRHLSHPLASPAMWEVRVAEGEAAHGHADRALERIERARRYHDPAAAARIEDLRAAGALPPVRRADQ